MHGSSNGTLVINISPMSEKDAENERLRKIARNSEQMTLPKSDGCGCESDVVRDVDVILYDHMDDDDESSLFTLDRMPAFADAMGASPEEIAMLEAQFGAERKGQMGEPKALSRFKQDYGDYKKFGGDVVAMELDRRMGDKPEMTELEMDDLLGFAMSSSPMMQMDNVMDQAEAAMQEQFGRGAMAVLEGEVDGVVSYSVDSPEMGRVKYVYDSKSGEGRVMRGE